MISRKQVGNLLRLTFAAALAVAAPTCSRAIPQTSPTITLSAVRIPAKGFLTVHGSGFTPKQDVRSHLRKPSGTEFPVLPMLTDDRGEFSHDIDTLLLAVGTHQLWVVDSTTGVSSNVATFEVTLDQASGAR
jgi:hypothetical protein